MLCMCHLFICYSLFFFKQKTAYEMRISDWSSDVCSSIAPMQPIGEVHRAACPPRRLRPPEGRDVIGGFVVGRNLEQLDAARAPAAHGLHPQAGTAFVPRFELLLGFKRTSERKNPRLNPRHQCRYCMPSLTLKKET